MKTLSEPIHAEVFDQQVLVLAVELDLTNWYAGHALVAYRDGRLVYLPISLLKHRWNADPA